MTRRESEVDTISNNVKLLNEMLDSYDPTRVSTSELDILKVCTRIWDVMKLMLVMLVMSVMSVEQSLVAMLVAHLYRS